MNSGDRLYIRFLGLYNLYLFTLVRCIFARLMLSTLAPTNACSLWDAAYGIPIYNRKRFAFGLETPYE